MARGPLSRSAASRGSAALAFLPVSASRINYTKPTEWAVSGGIGGRGLIPSRDNDCFGVGYYYNSIQTLRLSGLLARHSRVLKGTEHETASMLLEIRPAFPVKIQRIIKTYRNFVRKGITKYHTFASAHFHRFPP